MIEQFKKDAGMWTDTSGRWVNAESVDKLASLLIADFLNTLYKRGFEDAAFDLADYYEKDFGKI